MNSDAARARTSAMASRRTCFSAIWKALDKSPFAQSRILSNIGLDVFSGKRARFLGGFFGQADDSIDHRLHAAMAEHDRAQHDVFRQFLGLGFHHQHGAAGARHHQFQRGIGHVVDIGIEPVFAVDIADARRPDRPHEGNAGERQRRGRRHHRHHVGLVLHIVGQNLAYDLGFVLVAIGEQRTDRPVDQARGERFFFGRRAFALEIAARDLARGVIAFLVIDGEREEIDAFPGLLGADDGRQHHGLAIGGKHGAIGLARDAAGFKGEGSAPPFDFLFRDIEHSYVPSFPRPDCRRGLP